MSSQEVTIDSKHPPSGKNDSWMTTPNSPRAMQTCSRNVTKTNLVCRSCKFHGQARNKPLGWSPFFGLMLHGSWLKAHGS